jgi:hypothetical protein
MHPVTEQTSTRYPLVAAACLGLASVLAMGALEAHPRDDAQVAAIFSPWTGGGAFTRVAAAGGLVVRRGVIDTIVIVESDRPGLIGRLYAAGAWLVIDPGAFGGCLAGRTDIAG